MAKYVVADSGASVFLSAREIGIASAATALVGDDDVRLHGYLIDR